MRSGGQTNPDRGQTLAGRGGALGSGAGYLPSYGAEQVSGAPVVTLAALGDIVMHRPVIESGYDPAGHSFDFRPLFGELRPILRQADISVAVVETPLSGPERPYSGYPRFNSPYAIADAVQWAGVSLVFTAHNHALDQGSSGLRKTLAYYDRIGLRHAGSRSSPEQKRYVILDCRGIRLAFLAYTSSTNGIATPPGQEWLINRVDLARIAADIAAAKREGADGIVLALHAGVEYRRFPGPAQQRLCQRLVELGVDILLGSHVHVIQPLGWREVAGPDGRRRTAFIAYSLGNLLSNQRWRYTDCGLMVTLKLRKDPDRPQGIRILAADPTPLWVERSFRDGRYRYLIHPLAGPEAAAEPALSPKNRPRLREVWYDTEELLNGWPVYQTDQP
ncbi:CapA family protein [Hydrogenispora ethanolica]|nr:CapA family protein [Hydrogenispora ethanolica]